MPVHSNTLLLFIHGVPPNAMGCGCFFGGWTAIMPTYHDTASDTRAARQRIRALADRLTFVRDKTVHDALVHDLKREIAHVQKSRPQIDPVARSLESPRAARGISH